MPLALRMIEVLPVLREVDVISCCYSLGASKVAAWLQAVREEPMYSAQSMQLPAGFAVLMAKKVRMPKKGGFEAGRSLLLPPMAGWGMERQRASTATAPCFFNPLHPLFNPNPDHRRSAGGPGAPSC